MPLRITFNRMMQYSTFFLSFRQQLDASPMKILFTMTQLTSVDLEQLIQRFDQHDAVQALVLVGSYARNDAGPYSDIDLVRFVHSGRKCTDDGTHLDRNNRLINISSVEPEEYEKWFVEPYQATKWIAGLRIARVLIDRDGFFVCGLQERARNFIWTSTIQSRASIDACQRMIGWTEEVHKGLEGLHRGNDYGRLLHAIHGLSWGLSEVLQIQHGVLISSDNSLFEQIELTLGEEKNMIKLRRITFGIDGCYTLGERVRAGLEFYILLYEQMKIIWQEYDIRTIEQTVEQIREFLEQNRSSLLVKPLEEELT